MSDDRLEEFAFKEGFLHPSDKKLGKADVYIGVMCWFQDIMSVQISLFEVEQIVKDTLQLGEIYEIIDH